MNGRNIRVDIAYDGTEYYGWQRLKDFPTIQEELENFVLKEFGEQTTFHGAGRTDGGVHALCFPASFLLKNTAIPAERISLLLNRRLPPSIRVLRSLEVPENFHARFSCTAREYFYFVWNDKTIPPFFQRYAHCEFRPINIDKVRECCSLFTGAHNFQSFTSAYEEGFDYKRIVHYFRAQRRGQRIYYFIKGNGFLHGMIRDLVSLTIQYSLGNVTKGMILSALEGRSILPSAFRTRAPACGLYFKRAYY